MNGRKTESGKTAAEKKKEEMSMYFPLGICLGVGLGAAYGMLFDNLLVGICFGLAFGCVFGLLLSGTGRKKKKSGR